MILDTNAVSALFAGDRQLAAVLESSDYHHLPLVVIGEYQFGLLSSRKRKELQLLLAKLETESVVMAADRATADWYAKVRHELKMKGRPIPENDVWIAAIARQHTLEIVSNDAHFDHVDKIRRIGW
ncbi:MAG: type II toxin-antitoxin system VapC family toxin [Pirellulales bacterium]